MIKLFLGKFIKMLATKHAAIFLLKLAAKHSDNKVDDALVKVIEAVDDSNMPKFMAAVDMLAEEVKKELKKRDEK